MEAADKYVTQYGTNHIMRIGYDVTGDFSIPFDLFLFTPSVVINRAIHFLMALTTLLLLGYIIILLQEFSFFVFNCADEGVLMTKQGRPKPRWDTGLSATPVRTGGWANVKVAILEG